jgi:hypothetical protein
MNLPNYFLADLPAEATLSAGMVTEACRTLKRNRQRYLAPKTTESLLRSFDELARSWLNPDFRFRRHALEEGPARTGFSAAVLSDGLDHLFRELTGERLELLLSQEVGDRQRLDKWSSSPLERQTARSSLVRGPELLAQISGGLIPNGTIQGIVLGFLIRSAQFVKCASGGSFLPRLFAHSLYELEPKLGACLEIAEWRGGAADVEEALFTESDCITATGSDETLSQIRRKLPGGKRFVGYGHRVSFGYLTREALSGFGSPEWVRRAADDVVAWNQLGCLSPHVFYAENGGTISPEQFAELLANELDRREKEFPRGEVPAEVAATIASRRAFYEVRAAHSPETRHWFSPKSTAWSVVFEAEPRFQISCLNRFVYVKSVPGLTEALHGADAIRDAVSTVGIAATESRSAVIAAELARWGATRICPIGRMQRPPLLWRHDGHPALADLVVWSDWEHAD